MGNSQTPQQRQNDACNLFHFCTIPQAINFTQSEYDQNYCTTGEDAACVVEIIQKNRKYFTEKIHKDECQQPCHTIDYSYSKMRNSLPSSRQEAWYQQILAILIYLDIEISYMLRYSLIDFFFNF